MFDAYQAADAGHVTFLGLLDLSAAFDTFDHQILLSRLQHDYGITGRVIEWIQSYLTGRNQFIRFNSTSSRTMTVTSGVSQSSAEVINIVEHHGLKAHALADNQSRHSRRHFRSGRSDGGLHRACRGLHELKWPTSQPIEN